MDSEWLVRTFTMWGVTFQNWMVLFAAFALISFALAFLAEQRR